MVKTTYEAASMAIPRKELVDAVKRFLLNFGSHKDIALVDNIYSPKFGSSDLLFVNKARTTLTVVRLNDRDDCEKFLISSISYYFWLRQLISVGEVFFNGNSGLDMYLFSHDFSAPTRYLMDNLRKKLRVYLIKYNILQVEGLDEPAIHFQHVTPEDLAQDRPLRKDGVQEDVIQAEGRDTPAALEISAQELSEINRLKKLYLD